MPGSSPSASTRCAGCMRNGWCTSWTPSPIAPCRAADGPQADLELYADLKAYRANPSKAPPGAACPLRPHLPPSHRLRHAGPPAGAAACQQGRTADGAASGRKPAATNGSENDIRCQVTRRKVSAGTRSDPGATAAMPSSVSPRPAPSLAWRSGTISAAGSVRRCMRHSAPAGLPAATTRGSLSDAVRVNHQSRLNYGCHIPRSRQNPKILG